MDTSALLLLEYMCSDTTLCEIHINTPVKIKIQVIFL